MIIKNKSQPVDLMYCSSTQPIQSLWRGQGASVDYFFFFLEIHSVQGRCQKGTGVCPTYTGPRSQEVESSAWCGDQLPKSTLFETCGEFLLSDWLLSTCSNLRYPLDWFNLVRCDLGPGNV